MLFFFKDTATTEIYTLSLHDALPISQAAAPRPGGERGVRAAARAEADGDAAGRRTAAPGGGGRGAADGGVRARVRAGDGRSEEHTSELQSRQYLVCRLLLEQKKSAHA